MRYFIMPSCTGKTYYARRARPSHHFVVDVDAARTADLELVLRPLRDRRLWDQHNVVWHAVLTRFAAHLPHSAVVLVHSFADARAMNASPANAIAVLLPWPLIESRARARDHLSLALVKENYDVVAHEAQEYGLAVLRSQAVLDSLLDA